MPRHVQLDLVQEEILNPEGPATSAKAVVGKTLDVGQTFSIEAEVSTRAVKHSISRRIGATIWCCRSCNEGKPIPTFITLSDNDSSCNIHRQINSRGFTNKKPSFELNTQKIITVFQAAWYRKSLGFAVLR
jgi:ribosomal protein L37AE/L43A